MWLLSTSRAELRSFASHNQVIQDEGGFAILSHTWGDKEHSFQDVQKVASNARRREMNPRDLMPPKIRQCCELAEQDGYKWVWIDTCCIDKTSSAELSEAINSMFEWYSLSQVCYVYLEDWHADDCIPLRRFRRCRWFSRGWTLQELIAPTSVMFFNSSWHSLGSKVDITFELEQATRIPITLLRHEQPLYKFSIAQRMSWASRRQTTRQEDEAYSLLGIFEVNMPTIYGEGSNAFRRLQEEIMRRNSDPTLFAWGPTASLVRHNPITLEHLHTDVYVPSYVVSHDLLASFPADFRHCASIDYFDWVRGAPNGAIPRVPTMMTALGVHIPRVRIAQVGNSGLFLADFCLCDPQHGKHPYLALTVPRRQGDSSSTDTTSRQAPRRFNIGTGRPGNSDLSYRMVRLDVQPHVLQLEWHETDIYLMPQGSPDVGEALETRAAMDISRGDIPFRLSMSRLMQGYMSGGFLVKYRTDGAWVKSAPDDGQASHHALTMVCEGKPAGCTFCINLGTCRKKRRGWVRSRVVEVPWASVRASTMLDQHDCRTDHVRDWNDLTRRFVVKTRQGPYSITLSFTEMSDGSNLWMNDFIVEGAPDLVLKGVRDDAAMAPDRTIGTFSTCTEPSVADE